MTGRWFLWLAAIGTLVCAAGVAGAIMSSPPVRAAEPERPSRGYQIWIKHPGEDWKALRVKDREPWTFAGETACKVDLPGHVPDQPSGTLVECRYVNATTAARQ